jgi:hypothetical protein
MGLPVHQEHRDQVVVQGLQVRRVIQVHQDLLVHQVQMEVLVLRVQVVQMVLRDQVDHQVQVVHRVIQELRVLVVHLELAE